MFGSVKCDTPKRVAVLAVHRIADDGVEIGFARLVSECGAKRTVIVGDEIKILVVSVAGSSSEEW
jgi:hypothetical protein